MFKLSPLFLGGQTENYINSFIEAYSYLRLGGWVTINKRNESYITRNCDQKTIKTISVDSHSSTAASVVIISSHIISLSDQKNKTEKENENTNTNSNSYTHKKNVGTHTLITTNSLIIIEPKIM